MKTIPYQDICLVTTGYLLTPCTPDRLRSITGYWNEQYDDHKWPWPEYSMWDADIYPEYLKALANHGIAFGWEFVLTEDFSYYAYNFPTPESKNNLICYNSSSKKGLPRLTKKLRLALETESSINELVSVCLGIDTNGLT